MRRKVWFLEHYVDETGGEHTRKLPGVRCNKSSFGRVRIIYRGIDGRVYSARVRPHNLRKRIGPSRRAA